ncbi:PadR family transcriptional regulator [Staphylococcus sp. KG4-3]|uniref:PadR family transcriptional regulator n=1 Tax=Staphylococcus xylosus TaxID=1288 RepID=A0A418IRN9_STAXY|nr:PadR family transcriptional regulator [Staphylococcus xylosus]
MFRRQFHKGHAQFGNIMQDREDFGFGREIGDFGDFRGRERFFKKGDLQFVILKMLKEESKHGYQIIKDLEEQFKGFYSPSPGSVYPILQMLEDREFVSISKEGKKKIYTITDEGIAFLKENINDEVLQHFDQVKNMDFESMKEARVQLQILFKELINKNKEALNDKGKKQEFDNFIEKTMNDLNNLFK